MLTKLEAVTCLAGALVTGLFLTTPLTTVGRTLPHQPETSEVPTLVERVHEMKFDLLPGRNRVMIENFTGRLTMRPGARSAAIATVRVVGAGPSVPAAAQVAHRSGAELRLREEGLVISCTNASWEGQTSAVAVDLEWPYGRAIDLVAESAQIKIEGLHGAVRIGGGQVDVQEPSGPLDIRTRSADVTIHLARAIRHGGVVSTGSGRVVLDGQDGVPCGKAYIRVTTNVVARSHRGVVSNAYEGGETDPAVFHLTSLIGDVSAGPER